MLKGYSTRIEHFELEILESEIEKATEGIRGPGLHKLQMFSRKDLLCMSTRIMERRIQLRAIRSPPFVLSMDRKDAMFQNVNKKLLLASTMKRRAIWPGIVERDAKKTLF